jgi:hypothetical protein
LRVNFRSTNAVGLVEKVVPVAQCLLRVLIDRNGDRLDVLEAMAFTRGPLPQLGKRFDPWAPAPHLEGCRHLHHEAAGTEHSAPVWRAAMEALILVAETGGPTMLARVGIIRALNRRVVREFTDRKDHQGQAEAEKRSMSRIGRRTAPWKMLISREIAR